LLVQPALHDMAEHFEFPFAERVEARAQLTLSGALLAFALNASEGTFHRIDQLFLVIAGLQPRPNLTSKQITLLDFCNQLV
jgi:hypothetical protein